MQLVFIHGWGFDASFWDPLAALLSDYPQHRVERGYFGQPLSEIPAGPAVLIGHSLGFVHGLRQKRDWAGLVAINSFTQFIKKPDKFGYVPAAALRNLRARLMSDPQKTLQAFYELIGTKSTPVSAHPDLGCLCEGLDDLRDCNLDSILASLKVLGLALAARNDPLVPQQASEALSNSRVELIWHETGGHLLPQADPVWCAEAIKDFINSLE